MNEREYERMFRVEDSHWWYVSLHELILDFVTAEMGRGRTLRLLDAGCGAGGFAVVMQPDGRIVIGGAATLVCFPPSRADFALARYNSWGAKLKTDGGHSVTASIELR